MTPEELSLCGDLAREILAESIRNGCTPSEAIEHAEAMRDEIPLLVAQVLHEVQLELEQGGRPA